MMTYNSVRFSKIKILQNLIAIQIQACGIYSQIKNYRNGMTPKDKYFFCCKYTLMTKKPILLSQLIEKLGFLIPLRLLGYNADNNHKKIPSLDKN